MHGFTALSDAETAALVAAAGSLPNGSRILEIGTFHGVTARRLADAAPRCRVVCVDTFYRCHKVTPAEWHANRRENMNLWIGTAAELADVAYGRSFSLAFVDAMPPREACLADLATADRMLNLAGRLFAHDYDAAKWPGVVQAVDEFCTLNGLAVVNRWESLVEIALPLRAAKA